MPYAKQGNILPVISGSPTSGLSRGGSSIGAFDVGASPFNKQRTNPSASNNDPISSTIPQPAVPFVMIRPETMRENYYNRIFVYPPVLQITNPIIGAPQTYQVWNAFLDYTPNVIGSIVEDETTGITNTAAVTDSYRRTEMKDYEVTITSAAPVNIDATWTFNFTFGSGTFNLIASLADTVVLRPNEPMVENIEYRTDVIKKWTGSEQRIAVRGNEPKRTYDLSFTFTDDAVIREERGRLFNNPNGTIVVPKWYDFALTDAAVAPGASTITGDFSQFDINVDDQIFIITENDTVSQLNKVVTKNDTTITLSNQLNSNYPINSVVYPALILTATKPLGLDLYPVNAAEYDFSMVDNNRIPFGGISASLNTFLTRTYLDKRPLNEDPFGDIFDSNAQIIDYGQGFLAQTSQEWPNLKREVSYFVNGKDDLQYWKLFLDTVYGRRELFYTPTYRPDIEAISVAGGATTIEIVYDSRIATWIQSESHKNIRIIMNPGLVEHTTTINSVIDNQDGTGILQLNDAVPNLGGGETVVEINFIQLARLGSDTVRFEHYSLYSIITLSLETVEA